MLILTDIHGCYYTMLQLLAKCPKDQQIVFAGDLVDRGPHSRQVVEYAMKNKIPTVAGNHESLALFHHNRINSTIYKDHDIWLLNGGQSTLDSWGSDKLPDDVLDWMAALPYYLEYRNLLVSHNGHGKGTKTKRNIFGEEDPRDMLLWYRDTNFPDDGSYRVFGHTSSDEPEITETYANIDTAAAYGGGLTAFHWPSKKTWYQPFDESSL